MRRYRCLRTLQDAANSGLLTWMSIHLATGLSSGFVFGLFTFVLAMCGGNVWATVIVFHFQGIVAGLINLIWAPILIGFLSIIASLLSYPLARFLTRPS